MMIILGVFLALCLFIVILFIVSPKPTALLIRRLFEGGVAVKPSNYNEIEKLVHIENDIPYNSNYNEGKLDIIKPKEFEGYLPVIFWIHGGAFLAGIEGVVSKDNIRGVLLFCGPYDVSKLSSSDNFLINFLFKRVGWAYIGERNWTNTDKVKKASILHHVSSNFPPTFITDGNVGSFEDQGKELADKLKNSGVEVTQVFYSLEEAKLGHEYQFMMNTPQAENTFNKLIQFLDYTSNNMKN